MSSMWSLAFKGIIIHNFNEESNCTLYVYTCQMQYTIHVQLLIEQAVCLLTKNSKGNMLYIIATSSDLQATYFQ